jgi:hypothetical protein
MVSGSASIWETGLGAIDISANMLGDQSLISTMGDIKGGSINSAAGALDGGSLKGAMGVLAVGS